MTTNELLALCGAIGGAVGAVTGAAALTWEVFREWRERGRIKVSIYVGEHHVRDRGGYEKTGDVTVMGAAVNMGRRPVHISSIQIRLKDKSWRMVDPNTPPSLTYELPRFPHKLEEGKPVAFRLPIELFRPDAATCVVIDTLNHEWPVSCKEFKAVQQNAIEHMERESRNASNAKAIDG